MLSEQRDRTAISVQFADHLLFDPWTRIGVLRGPKESNAHMIFYMRSQLCGCQNGMPDLASLACLLSWPAVTPRFEFSCGLQSKPRFFSEGTFLKQLSNAFKLAGCLMHLDAMRQVSGSGVF